VPPYHADPLADREHAGRLLLDRSLKRGARHGERAADRQRLVVVTLEPFLDLEIEAGQLVVL